MSNNSTLIDNCDVIKSFNENKHNEKINEFVYVDSIEFKKKKFHSNERDFYCFNRIKIKC